jgi:hypothetical protein
MIFIKFILEDFFRPQHLYYDNLSLYGGVKNCINELKLCK